MVGRPLRGKRRGARRLRSPIHINLPACVQRLGGPVADLDEATRGWLELRGPGKLVLRSPRVWSPIWSSPAARQDREAQRQPNSGRGHAGVAQPGRAAAF